MHLKSLFVCIPGGRISRVVDKDPDADDGLHDIKIGQHDIHVGGVHIALLNHQ